MSSHKLVPGFDTYQGSVHGGLPQVLPILWEIPLPIVNLNSTSWYLCLPRVNLSDGFNFDPCLASDLQKLF